MGKTVDSEEHANKQIPAQEDGCSWAEENAFHEVLTQEESGYEDASSGAKISYQAVAQDSKDEQFQDAGQDLPISYSWLQDDPNTHEVDTWVPTPSPMKSQRLELSPRS